MLHFLHPGIGISKIELGKSCHSGRSDNVEPESFGKIRSYEIPACAGMTTSIKFYSYPESYSFGSGKCLTQFLLQVLNRKTL